MKGRNRRSTGCRQRLLPSQQMCDRFVGVQKPQQAQKPNEHNLAEDWKGVDQEGHGPTNNCCFDQIQDVHTSAFKLFSVCGPFAPASPATTPLDQRLRLYYIAPQVLCQPKKPFQWIFLNGKINCHASSYIP